ncbi:MAG: response regulator transcription factor, partial [Panacagrimonas sp.]
PASSARALRGQFRNAESDAGRLRLLEAATSAVAEDPSLKSAVGSVLRHALNFLAAESGLVLSQDAGSLTVLASQGAVLPVGARIVAGGALGQVLRPPMQAVLRERVDSRLCMARDSTLAFELLLPLRFGARSQGILAMMSESGRLYPTDADLRSLSAVATLLGTALGHDSASRPRPAKREASASLARLTAREQQVLALLPRGLSNAEIAGELGIATGTAKVHIERILHKLGLKHRTQAAVRAAEWGHRA